MTTNPDEAASYAFVLMPFDASFQDIYDQLIRPALEEAGYEVARADSVLTQQNILRDVIRGIATAHLVVADISTNNPNVMYELGICHGLRVPAILITQGLDDVPFDLRSYRIITYSTEFSEALALKSELAAVASRHREGKVPFGSPVLDFLATATHEVEVRVTGEAQLASDDDDDDDDEPGTILDLVVAMEDASERLAELLEEINSHTTVYGDAIGTRTVQLNALNDEDTPDARRALGIIALAAGDMTTYADAVDALLPELEGVVDALNENVSAFIAAIELGSEEDAEQATALRTTFTETRDVTRNSLESVRGFRDSVQDLPTVSRVINRPRQRVVRTLHRQINAFERVEAFAVRTVALLDAELESWKSQHGA